MAVNDVYEVACEGKLGDQNVAVVFHVRESDACTDMIPAHSVAKAVDAAWIAVLADGQSAEMMWGMITARRIDPAPGPTYTLVVTRNGGVAGDSVPSTSAVVLSWLTTTATKRGRGRTFVPGIPEASQAHGNLNSAGLAAMQDAVDAFVLPAPSFGGDTGEWALCVWSRVAGSATDVIFGVVRTNLATQRGRRQHPSVST